MSYLKRISVSLGAQIENLISQVEDHEAVVDAAIADAQKSLASAKVRLARVLKDEHKLQSQLTSQQAEEQKWRQRAKQIAAEDESTAIECLRRSKEAAIRIQGLQQASQEHQRQVQQLQAMVNSAEQQIQERIQRKNLMSTRENALRSSHSLERTTSAMGTDWEQTFDRWETRITEMEIASSINPSADLLDEEFSSKEVQRELKLELDALLREEASND